VIASSAAALGSSNSTRSATGIFSDATTVNSLPRPAVAYQPLAQAMPITLISLCQAASRTGIISLPSPSVFSEDPEKDKVLQNKFSERTGIHPPRTVIGSTVSASAQSVAKNGSLTSSRDACTTC
jgi:hypothetical protein